VAKQHDGDLIAAASGNNVLLATQPRPLSRAERYRHRQAARHWHASQAEQWEGAGQWPAAAFHLERLHRHSPDASTRKRLLAALKQAGHSPLTRSIWANLLVTDAVQAVKAIAAQAAR
jgi:hypothetical protein